MFVSVDSFSFPLALSLSLDYSQCPWEEMDIGHYEFPFALKVCVYDTRVSYINTYIDSSSPMSIIHPAWKIPRDLLYAMFGPHKLMDLHYNLESRAGNTLRLIDPSSYLRQVKKKGTEHGSGVVKGETRR